ncbi:Ig domain-containing protein [Diaphorobacter ruginosibacter]|uniref:Ig domain-containing protein n=1 Tax=Diaphorobacter ruginosibacter TaxID=1715720 RepID=UPI0033401059
MKKILKLSSLLVAAALAACGGGGGSGGTSAQQYSITLRADKTQLPINIDPANNVAGIGAYAPYTTTLYVNAETGGQPIPGGDDIFGCNMVAGLDSGALYYLDGETEGAFRSITLGSNTGGNSFHFHASNTAGTARIECSVTDPRDQKIYKASVDITVGAATGKPAWVIGQAQAGTNLGTSTNLVNLPNSVAVQATIYDDANQAIPNPTAANLQVSVLPLSSSSTDASIGAQVVSGSQKGSSVQVQSVGGTAQFSLQSGRYEGPILLQLVADRSDNNVANGIQEAITSYVVVSAYANLVSSDPLALVTDSPAAAVNGMPYSYVLEASGGNAPYTWAITGLPTGLKLNSSTGLISGTPAVKTPGSFQVVIKVTDSAGASVQKNTTFTVSGDAVVDALNINLSGCSGDINNVCLIPNATMGSMYQYAFSATGGDSSVPVVWTFSGLPAWLSGSSSGSYGFVSGTPTSTTTVDADSGTETTTGAACGAVGFLVTATSGSVTATKRVSFTLSAGSTQKCP